MCKIFVVTNVICSNSMCAKKDGVVGDIVACIQMFLSLDYCQAIALLLLTAGYRPC